MDKTAAFDTKLEIWGKTQC